MTNEDFKTIAAVATPALVILGRLWSMVEHKKTGKKVAQQQKDIMEIKISINGELEKRIQEARERAVRDYIEKNNQHG